VIHVIDLNGTEVLTLHDVAGSVLWPGWTRVDDKMTLTNAAVATLRLHADITTAPAAGLAVAAVVTTGDVAVSFPMADTECIGLPSSVPVAPTVKGADVAAQTLSAGPQELPATGTPATTLAIIGVVLTLAGIVLVMRFRTDRTAA
jgi:LPXTG-motif cell wall-anchored protein